MSTFCPLRMYVPGTCLYEYLAFILTGYLWTPFHEARYRPILMQSDGEDNKCRLPVRFVRTHDICMNISM